VQIPPNKEPLGSKVQRLMEAHNNHVAETKINANVTQRLINNLMYIFENEIEDFQEKYMEADFRTGVEEIITRRLTAHINADLLGFQTAGQELALTRQKAKADDKLNLYNEICATMRKNIAETDFPPNAPPIDPKRITAVPTLTIVENENRLVQE